MELFKAHDQWASRPADERFETLQDLFAVTHSYALTAREKPDVRLADLRVEAVDGAVQLIGRGGVPARLTHWSFGQLAARVGAPAAYIRQLPATLAAQNVNHGLSRRVKGDGETTASLLFHENGGLLLRAITSDRYSRVWNYEVAQRLLDLESRGWAPAVPDVRGISGAGQKPLYASDHDMFAFVTHPDRTIREQGNPSGLRRGLIASNSEVGAGALRLTRFLYREMCGNHIIWGAESVVDLKAIHVGRVRERFDAWKIELVKYLDASVSDDEARIEHARTTRIAATKGEVLDLLFGKLSLSRKVLEAGYAAVQDGDGDPLTPWGVAQGLTRHSQTIPYADERMQVDRAAGKLIDMF